jgi:hypothetical protein
LKTWFHGRAAYDANTGVLTLVYDFTSYDQLKDFKLNGSRPTVSKGTLKLGAGTPIQHVVPFRTLTLHTKVANPGEKSWFVSCARASFWTDANRTCLGIHEGGKLVEKVTARRHAPGRSWKVELKVNGGWVTYNKTPGKDRLVFDGTKVLHFWCSGECSGRPGDLAESRRNPRVIASNSALLLGPRQDLPEKIRV